MDKKQYYFLSGLPRSGSTLLSSLLSQNDKIYAGGNSPICQLMWDMQVSVHTNSYQQIMANNSLDIANNLISKIPSLYYSNINKKVIIDKCRSWTHYKNINTISKYITETPKIITLVRPIEDILNSFCFLFEKNKKPYVIEEFLSISSEPIMRSFESIINMVNNQNSNTYTIIEYDNLVNNPKETLKIIYDFCEWDYFKHTFNNIKNIYPENDEFYGLKGFHSIRTKLNKRTIKNYLSIDNLKKCYELNKLLDITIKNKPFTNQ